MTCRSFVEQISTGYNTIQACFRPSLVPFKRFHFKVRWPSWLWRQVKVLKPQQLLYNNLLVRKSMGSSPILIILFAFLYHLLTMMRTCYMVNNLIVCSWSCGGWGGVPRYQTFLWVDFWEGHVKIFSRGFVSSVSDLLWPSLFPFGRRACIRVCVWENNLSEIVYSRDTSLFSSC